MTTTTTADLLADLLGLVDARRPPHAGGPCTALCAPSCWSGPAAGQRAELGEEVELVDVEPGAGQ